ncbi:MAG: outer membrane protein assembly factor BamA [Alphaproteobacteria bacterium]|nr:outer membrane protein assembly factor BamA [Alphaproteobacteria bacterium]MDP7055605.1 outer membrane protein assembly factor BamA [Alphaproteobacteria bacterium]MDP7229239.1 outer membrane protein assembly factor BamA [Alphaproteobacteria bacterium]MDP7460665.1 outer membrane protein assembly factor BamA [Alphaproteobacteria bacterium]HJM92609.1 outer membrane protein assembly factor BamA [Alphaproteobacteria bacterium]
MRFRLIPLPFTATFIAAFLTLLATAVPVLAQSVSAASSATVARIDVKGNQRIEALTVQSYMTIGAGDPFDARQVDQSLKALFATGLFADIAIRRQGNILVVDLVENPIINQLAFEGNKRVEDDALEQEVQLRPRIVYTRSRVQADVQRILQIYRRSGRYAASVEPKIIQLEQNRVDLIFEINEGPVTGIRRIDIIGNKKFDDGKLRRTIATKETRWYRFFSSDDNYDPDRVTLDRELLRKFYLERGYADFRVLSAVAELTHERSNFFLTFTVEEGELYKFGKIELATTLRDLDAETLRGSLTITEGETYNAEAIEKSIEKLNFAVGARGYAFVDIRPRVKRLRDQRLIELVLQINEGPRVYIDRISINGNTRTLDKVIRREMRLVEGDAFNTAKLRRSRQQIRRLGFFDKVDVAQAPGEAPDKVVIDIDVQERSTGELSFGLGISTTETVVGDVSIRERNLLGKAQDLKLSLGLSAKRQQVDLSFTEPYFLDRHVSAGFDIFSLKEDQQDRSSFDEKSNGFSLRSRFPITENLKQGLRYTLREDTIENIDNDTSSFIRVDAGDYVTSAISYGLTYDTRDDIFLPTTGIIIGGSQELAGLGGDVQFIRSTAKLSYFYPFTQDMVANAALKGGHILGLDQDVRVLNRFFLGGDNFRGFETGGLGPRDSSTDDAIGGNTYFVATGEMRFPIGLPNDFGILGRAFTEVGTLLDPDVSGANLLDSNGPRVSIGVGVSWRSPFGPIRVDLAQAVVKENFDKEELFRFSFGTRF